MSFFFLLQLEIVNLNSTRQQLEHELGCARLDLDGSRQELRSERARHETEIDSLRGRLKRTEEQLVKILFLAKQFFGCSLIDGSRSVPVLI